MKLAYYFSTFPSLSTTFLQREVKGLTALGFDLILTANRRPRDADVHPGDRELAGRTVYLDQGSIFAFGWAVVKQALAHPGGFWRAVRKAWRLREGRLLQGLRNLGRVAAAALLAEVVARQGVTHLHVHFAFGAAGVALLLKEMTGMPYSLSVHGSDALLPQPYVAEKLAQAAFIVSNCRYHIENLPRRFPALAEGRFHLVRLGIDLADPHWRPTAPPDLKSGLRILHVGRLEPVKAQEVLIEACARLKALNIAFECRIVGQGPLREQLSNLIARLGLRDSVVLLGPRYEDEVAELMDWAHVFVLSSKSEGTPMTVIEAMAKARPVIAPHITALPEMIEHGASGFLFSPGDATELADALSRLARSPALIPRLGAAGRRRAEENHDLGRNTSGLAAIFRTELNDNGRLNP